MRFIYTLGVVLYALGVRVASIFLPKAKEWVDGRNNFWNQLPDISNKKVYWFHCASLGEFDQGLPVMNLIRKNDPEIFILVTFFSPSGYKHYNKRKNPVDYACYLPIDTKANAQKFVKHFQPKTVFFVKYEFWANYIFEIKKQKCQLYSLSTLLRPKHHFFKWYGSFFREILHQFDYFFVQDQQTFDLLRSININKAIITGDTRFDRVIENKNNLVLDEIISDFVGESKSVFIAGSTWQKDVELIKPIIGSSMFEKYIIVPHNVDEASIKSLTSFLDIVILRYSDLKDHSSTISNVLIVDTIGLLASAYSFGTIAYVGGGFSKSLHNILEPAVFGLPVIFGPVYNRFPEAQAFIDNGIGFSVKESDELSQTIESIKMKIDEIQSKSSQFIESNKGASQKIIAYLS